MKDTASKCRACGAEILFMRTQNFKTIPVNAEPVYIHQESGGKPYFRPDGSSIVGYIVGDAYDDPDTNLIMAYESHFATCPEADSFRKKRKRDRTRTGRNR